MSTVEEITGELVTNEDLNPSQPPALFQTADPVEVVQRASTVADALKDVIVAKNLFTMVNGKPHVHIDGWQLCASMLGVTAVVVDTEPVDGGFKARAEARTADGRVIGAADALCTKHEKRGPWKNADDYARLSMAQTRAMAKALKGPLGFVISLAGYQSTPLEEMSGVSHTEPPALAHPELQTAYREWLANGGDVGALRQAVKEAGGSGATMSEAITSLPQAGARSLLEWLLASEVQA